MLTLTAIPSPRLAKATGVERELQMFTREVRQKFYGYTINCRLDAYHINIDFTPKDSIRTDIKDVQHLLKLYNDWFKKNHADAITLPFALVDNTWTSGARKKRKPKDNN